MVKDVPTKSTKPKRENLPFAVAKVLMDNSLVYTPTGFLGSPEHKKLIEKKLVISFGNHNDRFSG